MRATGCENGHAAEWEEAIDIDARWIYGAERGVDAVLAVIIFIFLDVMASREEGDLRVERNQRRSPETPIRAIRWVSESRDRPATDRRRPDTGAR
ncbi:MAG: hypothetical protein QM736_04785 [Vicinamibacterales bacterium]